MSEEYLEESTLQAIKSLCGQVVQSFQGAESIGNSLHVSNSKRQTLKFISVNVRNTLALWQEIPSFWKSRLEGLYLEAKELWGKGGRTGRQEIFKKETGKEKKGKGTLK